MTKIKVVTVPRSMLPRPKQVESSDLRFGSCIDELVPALRVEIKKANGDSDAIIKWQQKEIKRYSDITNDFSNDVDIPEPYFDEFEDIPF